MLSIADIPRYTDAFTILSLPKNLTTLTLSHQSSSPGSLAAPVFPRQYLLRRLLHFSAHQIHITTIEI